MADQQVMPYRNQLALAPLGMAAAYAYPQVRQFVGDLYQGAQTVSGYYPKKRAKAFRGARPKYYVRPKRQMRKGKTLTTQVKEIKKSIKADQAFHTHRVRHTADIDCNANESSYTTFASTSTTSLETAMANLRYYNPAVPGTLTTADASTGTYSRQVHFSSIYKKVTCVNNYNVPVKCTVYSYVPKADTSLTPVQFYTAGITDQGVGLSATSPLMHITDIDMVNDNWKILKSSSKHLFPGSSMTCVYTKGSFDYDPANVDTHSSLFQKKYGAHIWVIKLEGHLGHDTIADEQTTLSGSVDVLNDQVYKITYDAGVNLKDFSYSNNASTSFTNSGVCSVRPVSDNQTYDQT